MGHGQSTQGRLKDAIIRNDSTLEFDPGKKIKTPEIDIIGPDDAFIESIDYDLDEGLQQVTDDGGKGYIPTETETVKRKSTVPVVFRWEYGGKEVYISGTFNDWKTKIPMTYCGGEFTAIIELVSGEHEFKYLVDGHWIHDPSQKTSNDTFGGCNNVMVVTESDFDATEALLSDECSGSTGTMSNKSSSPSLTRLSPPGSYTNLVPDTRNTNSDFIEALSSSVPPALPPHLLNVILNKEGFDDEDPTILPTPNHVALNHLYALSIKDSVMTMSATHRYKRKYITTLFYKPIKVN